MNDLLKPDYARNMRIVGHSDQGGRPDAVQVMVQGGFAYVGHMFSKGFSVLDVRDPKKPRAVNYIPAPANTWNIHLQVHDDLLLVIHAKDMFAAAEFGRRTCLLQRSAWQDRRHRRSKTNARLERRSGGVRYLDAGKPPPHRLHDSRGRRHPSYLVRRRTLGLWIGFARRLYRLHLHDRRHERSDAAARIRALVDCRNEPGG